ncbi:MAG: aryl-sulfate sulfotransferase [Planctomycetota bacterium]|nr:aryl-sulfate sulfotransferase [Planctomycetota bacterium]
MQHPELVLILALALPTLAQEEDAEEEVRGLLVREEGAFEGYTMISPLQSDRVLLLDMDGEVVHEWKTDQAPGGGFYLLESGNVLRCGRQDDNPRFHGGGIGGRIREYDWEGNVVWDYELANDRQTQHHDVEPLPNGNVLVICWEFRTPEEVAAAGRDPAAIGDDGLWSDAVLELRPTRPEGAEVVWEWHGWDHLIQDFDQRKAGYGSIPEHPERIDINADHRDKPPMTEAERREMEELEREMRALGYVGGDEDEEEDDGPNERAKRPDWLHTNAIAYHPGHDLIALSVPRLNEVWVIDHSTTTTEAAGKRGGKWGRGGDLLYRWGNPRVYGAGEDSDRRLWFQHDPTWVGGPDELRLLVFNNGMSRPGDFSVVEEIALPFDLERGFAREAGAAFGPIEAVWSYSDKGNFFSAFISGAQRLPNGNTLICSGAPGRVFEVTPEKKIVWDFLNPHGGEVPPTDQSGNAPPTALFRATRIAADHPGLAGRL